MSTNLKVGAQIFSKIKDSGTTLSLFFVYLILCAVFTILSPFFLTLNNFLNIGTYSSIIGVMAVGVTISMLLGAIDISQYSVATLSGMVAGILMSQGTNVFFVVLAALLVGVLCGVVNGLLIASLKISAIIATLGTMQIFRGIAYLTTNGSTVMIANPTYALIGRGFLFNAVPIALVIMIIAFILAFLMLKYTKFGRYVFAVGGNESASYLTGINIMKVKMKALIISAVCASVGGIIVTSQVGAAIPTTGIGMEMGVLSAVILGGLSLSGGKGKISGTLIGVLILATIQNGLTLLSVRTFYQMIINGAVLILAVTMDVIRSGALTKK